VKLTVFVNTARKEIRWLLSIRHKQFIVSACMDRFDTIRGSGEMPRLGTDNGALDMELPI
jgi:hypothetical protein